VRINSLTSTTFFGTIGSTIINKLPLTPEKDRADPRNFTSTSFLFWKAVNEKVMTINKRQNPCVDEDASLRQTEISLEDLLDIEDPEIFERHNADDTIGLWLVLVFLCLDDCDKTPFASFPENQVKNVFLFFKRWKKGRSLVSRIHKDAWNKILRSAIKTEHHLDELEEFAIRVLLSEVSGLVTNEPTHFHGGY